MCVSGGITCHLIKHNKRWAFVVTVSGSPLRRSCSKNLFQYKCEAAIKLVNWVPVLDYNDMNW